MRFHTFGDKNDPAVILIHGMLTPWQIWDEAIESFADDHYVVVPALDAHTEEEASSFRSVDDEALQIEQYILENIGSKVYLICGLSMGGAISARIAERGNIQTEYLVLDGAPLIKVAGFLVGMLEKSYINIISKSKVRDPKTMKNCRRVFLPEKHIDEFLRIVDLMDEDSIGNMMSTVFEDDAIAAVKGEPHILYMHGTKSNEYFSGRSAEKFKEVNPQTEIKVFKGYAHAQLAVFEPEKWIGAVKEFLDE